NAPLREGTRKVCDGWFSAGTPSRNAMPLGRTELFCVRLHMGANLLDPSRVPIPCSVGERGATGLTRSLRISCLPQLRMMMNVEAGIACIPHQDDDLTGLQLRLLDLSQSKPDMITLLGARAKELDDLIRLATRIH